MLNFDSDFRDPWYGFAYLLSPGDMVATTAFPTITLSRALATKDCSVTPYGHPSMTKAE